MSLDEFASEVYAEFDLFRDRIPHKASDAFQRMGRENWLCSYRHVTGIRNIVGRIGARFRRPVNLSGATSELLVRRSEFEAAFNEFFPQLIAHTQVPT